MKFRFDLLTKWVNPNNTPTDERLDKYKIPETIGKPKQTKQQKMAMDSCFAPVRSLLSHALDNLSEEGLPAFPGYTMLVGLSQNPLIRSGVEMRAKEMTRKWGEIVRSGESDTDIGDTINRLERAMDRFHVKKLFREASEKNGYLGGCLVFIDTGEDTKELVNPLVLDSRTFQQGSLKGFKIIDPYVVYPGIYNANNPISENYYKPNVWYVQGIPVHASRFLIFRENELENMLKPAYNFFGISLAQKVLDAVSHYTQDRESASKLLKKIALVVLKTDMQDVLSGGADTDVRNRCQYFVNNWDYEGMAIIDKESEDMQIFNNSLSGVIDIVRQSMEHLASMFNEPATKLWGISPAGFNATGESDMKNHYDNIASLQEQQLGDNLQKVLQILQLNIFGKIDTDIEFKFLPLSDEADMAQANTNKVKAETDSIYVGLGAIGAEEVRNRLIEDKNSGYDNLTAYDLPPNPNKVPEPPLSAYSPEEQEAMKHGKEEPQPRT